MTVDGIVTGARSLGTVVDFGESLIEVDNRRVFLVDGDVPMFRDLELTSPRVAGEDVAQLQRFLIAKGFDRDGTLEADGVFDSDTRQGGDGLAGGDMAAEDRPRDAFRHGVQPRAVADRR